MSFLLDPIESGINDLLDPLTSVFAPPSPSTARTAQSTQTMGNSQSTTTSQDKPTASAASTVTPSVTAGSSTTPLTQSSPTTEAEPTTSRSTRIASGTSEDSSSSSTPSTVTKPTQTTLSTSTTSKLPLSTSSSAIPTTTSAPAAPSVTPHLSPAQSNSHDTAAHSQSGISTAGIVVAIVFAVALLASVIWLIFRFCPPVRRRIDAWLTKGREKRSYREAIDGPPPPEKDDTNSFSTHGSQQRKSVSAQAAEKIGVGKRPFSFFGIGTNPAIEQKNGYSWKVESASGPVHQQYLSPNSADTDTPRGNGLGLGRVSLLRNHSLLRKAGHDVPVPVHVPLPPSKAGPAPTTTRPPSQTEIASIGPTHKPKLIPLQSRQSQHQHQQSTNRKPLPARLPIAIVNNSRPFSYEDRNATVPQPQPSRSAQSIHTTSAKTTLPPRLQLEIPPTPTERRSQIGLAVTSSTPPVHGYAGNAG